MLAHRLISLPRSKQVAFGEKQTSSGSRKNDPEAVMSPADLHRDETIDSHLLARKETENGGIERRWIVSVHGVSGIGDHHRLGNVLALSHRLVHCAVSLRAPLSIQQ